MSKEQKAMNLSLIDLKALEKPAVKLIQSVANAVGIWYEPRRIVKRAQAEAEARIIQAEAEPIAEGVAARTRRRIEWLENQRQENIEAVTELALKFLPQTVSSEPVDQDWVVRFFEHCQDVNNQQMQSLWARLLSGEVAQPGSFSQRTLSIVREMRPQDANSFTKLATFFWNTTDFASASWFPMLKTFDGESWVRAALQFDDILQLDALNLIRHDATRGFRYAFAGQVIFKYYGSTYCAQTDRIEINVGECILTLAGEELAPIAGGNADPEYCLRAIEMFKTQGIELVKAS